MLFAVLLTALGGAVNGSFAVPMKRVKGWAWEHTWFTWAFSGLILVPGLATLLSVPHLPGVYAATSWSTLGLVAFFGFLWGIAGFLFGLGIDYLGLAVGFGIILGISSALGALGPLVVRHSEEMFTRTGLLTMTGALLVVLGVAGCAVAGRIRERAQGAGRRGSLVVGLLICIASGVMAPMMNFGLSYGSEIADNALRAGAGAIASLNAIWPVLLLGGFAANALYCAFLMIRNGSGWRPLVKVNPGANIPLGLLMGLLWMGGLLMYGSASRMLGPLGLVLGWPIMMGCTVLTANAWGVITGEWRGAPVSAKAWVAVGVALLVAGIAVISQASPPPV